PRLRIAQYSRKLDMPRLGWRTRQMALKAFSMVSNIISAVAIRKPTPNQVNCRAWSVKATRYCWMVAPVEGMKLLKMYIWICSPTPWNAGMADSMAKVTVIIGTTANNVV